MFPSPRKLLLLASLALTAAVGCEAPPRNMVAVSAYYRYHFTDAREALRADAYLRNDEQVLLNNLRLGIASLADGDLQESERALGNAFELLSTAGLNEDRTTTAVLTNEGVRIWKGEPFEQALAYYYVSTLYALKGEWDNARAAAANSLFRLTDFGGTKSPEELARRAARDDDYLESGYTAVDTNFALGLLMQAIASDISGASGSAEQLDAALEIDPGLQPLADALRAREYDTLLIVDYGKGPTKIAYGRDNAFVRFVEQDRPPGQLEVSVNGEPAASARIVADINQMARDHRWNALENVRRAKSILGDALLFSGAVVAMSAGNRDELVERGLIGLALAGAGLLSKSGAQADVRYMEFAPQSVYLVPLYLGEASTLRLTFGQSPQFVLPDVRPGESGRPRALYVRLLGPGSPRPQWLFSDELMYSNDHTGVAPDTWPWILGGWDVSKPSPNVLEDYQENGYLQDMTVSDLRALYEAEEINIGSGAETRPDVRRNPSYRHVLDGGTGLFTPAPDSMGYKQLMYQRWPAYEAKSPLVRNVRERVGVRKQGGLTPPSDVQ